MGIWDAVYQPGGHAGGLGETRGHGGDAWQAHAELLPLGFRAV